MRRNYIQPTSEYVEFGAGESLLTLTIGLGSDNKTMSVDQVESNRKDWEDDIDWGAEE